jgi:hypothetical protein
LKRRIFLLRRLIFEVGKVATSVTSLNANDLSGNIFSNTMATLVTVLVIKYLRLNGPQMGGGAGLFRAGIAGFLQLDCAA